MQKIGPTEQLPSVSPLDADVAQVHALMLDLGRLGPLRDPIAAACESSSLTPPQIHTLISLGHDCELLARVLEKEHARGVAASPKRR